MVKMATQMMSRACQNTLKHSSRRRMCWREALGPDLRHHRPEPQQAGGDVRAVAADQREEGRQEGAALRPRAFADHRREFVELDRQEDQAEQAGQQQPDLRPRHVAALGGDHRQAADEARQRAAPSSRPRPGCGRTAGWWSGRRRSRGPASRRSRTGPRTAPCPTARTARSRRGRRCSSTPARDGRGRCLPSPSWVRPTAGASLIVLMSTGSDCGGVPCGCGAARARSPAPPRPG